MSQVLQQAVDLLDGTDGPPGQSARAAAWLTRSALEEALRELIRARRCDPGGANGRSMLSCVESLYRYDSDIAAKAEYAWARLSGASHHHAYELAPTHSEVRSLIALVAELEQQVEQQFAPR